MSNEMVRPFDSFTAVYKMLIWAGYYKLLKAPSSELKRICHQVYRPFAFLVALVFNIQHIIFIIQRRANIDDVFDSLVIEIPQVNLLVKYLTLNLQSDRITRIHELLENFNPFIHGLPSFDRFMFIEPIFAAHNKVNEELLRKNTKDMHRLFKIINIGITIAGLAWPTSYFVKRYHDITAVVPSYVPFETTTWARFTCSVMEEVIPLLWVGYGHMALDCAVATYYAQAEVQLKIIKYNLQHLFDSIDTIPGYHSLRYNQYSDQIDKDLKERFIYIVERFEKVAWYTNEIDDVFNFSMSFQFFTSSVTICTVIYRLTLTNVLSVPFLYLAVLLLLLITQVFLYCYYGNLVQYESQSVVDSIYLSDWLSSSPQFRRLLLIAMQRWSRALQPRVTGIIPLSLTTFLSIVHSAYSLYAVLRTKQG